MSGPQRENEHRDPRDLRREIRQGTCSGVCLFSLEWPLDLVCLMRGAMTCPGILCSEQTPHGNQLARERPCPTRRCLLDL